MMRNKADKAKKWINNRDNKNPTERFETKGRSDFGKNYSLVFHKEYKKYETHPGVVAASSVLLILSGKT